MHSMTRVSAALLAAVVSVLAATGAVFAQDPSDVALDSPIRAITLGPTEVKADLDVDLFNYASARRVVKMTLDGVPEGWDVDVWNAFFNFRISEIVVEPTETTPGQRPRLRARLPEERPEPGSYSFTLVLTDAENPGIEYDRARYTITVPKEQPKDPGKVTLRSDFPVLRGPATSRYEFEVIVKNETGDQRAFDLSANVVKDDEVQQGWLIGFTPAFGEEKLISSVTILDKLDERVNVQITPPRFARPGEYFIPVTAEGEEFVGRTVLALSIAGRGELRATTPTGLLSLDATAGKEASVTLQLENVGTGDLRDIGLLADTPNEWQVTFQVDNVESLPANNIIPIGVTVKPPEDIIPGDYVLTLRGRSLDGSASASVDLRVTVEQSTIWGWLGIVLVVVVLGGLAGLFWRLGRR